MKKLKLISKKYINEPIKVYDIEVKDEHHYFLENGLLSHNSMSMFSSKEISGGGGVKYNASIILILGKGKLDDAEGEKKAKEKNVDATKVGVTIYVTPYKNRYAKPIKVQMHIPFFKKPNPFVGLEKFVSWEACGIMRGKALTEKEYSKLKPAEQEKCFEFEDPSDKSIGFQKKYAFPMDTARSLVTKHLGQIPLGELFTEKVFTQEVLKELDENVIKPTFMLPSIESLDDLAELTQELEDEGDQEGED
jgi:hypothetical protein